MNNLLENIIVALVGLSLGYLSSLLLAKYNAKMALQRELKNSIAERKSEFYIDLWFLCNYNFRTKEEAQIRCDELHQWYNKGGGLMLSFKATDHFFSSINILEKDFAIKKNELKSHLTWLRTEMKYEVGSYSRKEANTTLPSTLLK